MTAYFSLLLLIWTAVWDFFLEMISTFTSGALFLTNLGNHESDSPKSASFYDGTDSGACLSNFTSKLSSTAFGHYLFDKMPIICSRRWVRCDLHCPDASAIPLHCQQTMVVIRYRYYPHDGHEHWTRFPRRERPVQMVREACSFVLPLASLSSYHPIRHLTGLLLFTDSNRIMNDLASVDRSKTPWIIFGGHRPMYVSSNYGGPGFKLGADINVMNLMVRTKSKCSVRFIGLIWGSLCESFKFLTCPVDMNLHYFLLFSSFLVSLLFSSLSSLLRLQMSSPYSSSTAST